MHELRLEPGLGRDPPGRDRGVALLAAAAARPRRAAGRGSWSPAAPIRRGEGAVVTPTPCHVRPARMLSNCTALLCECTAARRPGSDRVAATGRRSTSSPTSRSSRTRTLLRRAARGVPGAAAPPSRRGRGHRLRRGERGLPRHRHVLVVQLGRSARSPTFPVPLEGDDVSDIIDRLPRPAADARAHGHDGPARRTPGAGAADAADHAEAAEGQRGVHVAPRRPAARRVRRRRPLRVHQRVHAAVRDARRRRPARRAGGGSPAVPRGLRPEPATRARSAPGERGRPGAQRAGVARRPVRRSTSRTGGASRATTCSPTSRSRPTPTAPRPTSSPSCARRPSCSPPGQETTARLLAAALKHLAEHPELQDELRGEPRPHPGLPRRGAAHREPGEGRLPARPPRHDGRRRRHRGRARR